MALHKRANAGRRTGQESVCRCACRQTVKGVAFSDADSMNHPMPLPPQKGEGAGGLCWPQLGA